MIEALIALISFNVGLLVGAWWNSRPISDLEKREIHHSRHDEHREPYE